MPVRAHLARSWRYAITAGRAEILDRTEMVRNKTYLRQCSLSEAIGRTVRMIVGKILSRATLQGTSGCSDEFDQCILNHVLRGLRSTRDSRTGLWISRALGRPCLPCRSGTTCTDLGCRADQQPVQIAVLQAQVTNI